MSVNSMSFSTSVSPDLDIAPVNLSLSLGLQVLSIIGVLITLASKFAVPAKQTNGKALPTPGGLPWAGPVWAVETANIYKTFKAWAEKFGTLYEVQIFGTNLIIVSDPVIAKEILAQKASVVSDRPSIAVVQNSKESGRYLPFLGNNEILSKQRRFGVLINTYTHQMNYHDRLIPETTRFASRLLEQRDHPFILLEKLCGRISCRMAFGTPAPHASITRSAHGLMRNLSPGGKITNVLTFLRHLPSFINSDVHSEMVRVDIEDRVWHCSFAKAKEAYAAGTLKPCYAKYYFDNQAKIGLTEQEALYGIAMMATVSILTIVAPLQRWLVAMAEHPEWQEKVHQELKEQLQGRMADHSDSPKLPVLRATLLESMRWASPLPTGIPHRLEEDMVYNGYHLSKNSNVLACDWSISHSPTIHQNPTQFLPSRYLDPTSSTYRTPLTVYPKIQSHSVFGYGRRICIGQDYATSQMLVICAAILTFFRFEIPASSSTTTEPVQSGAETKKWSTTCIEGSTPHVIPIMDEVDIKFIARDAGAAGRVRELYGEMLAGDAEKWEDECL